MTLVSASNGYFAATLGAALIIVGTILFFNSILLKIGDAVFLFGIASFVGVEQCLKNISNQKYGTRLMFLIGFVLTWMFDWPFIGILLQIPAIASLIFDWFKGGSTDYSTQASSWLLPKFLSWIPFASFLQPKVDTSIV